MTREPHGLPGHINIYVRDHDSPITARGRHDRVIAFLPDVDGLFMRIDHCHGLGMPTPAEMLTAARRDQGIRGRWTLDRIEAGDRCSYVYFRRCA